MYKLAILVVTIGLVACSSKSHISLSITVSPKVSGLILLCSDSSMRLVDGRYEAFQVGNRMYLPAAFFVPGNSWSIRDIHTTKGENVSADEDSPNGVLAFRGYVNINGSEYFVFGKEAGIPTQLPAKAE